MDFDEALKQYANDMRLKLNMRYQLALYPQQINSNKMNDFLTLRNGVVLLGGTEPMVC
jgi:hypothetical protein